METRSAQNSGGANSFVHKFILYVIIGFAIVGLISGFTVGGLTHATSTSPTTNIVPKKASTPVKHPTIGITVTPTTQPIVPLDIPQFTPYPTANASGTGYTVGIQVIDKQKKPILHTTNITCKAWLVQNIPTNQILSIDDKTLKAVSTISQSIIGTVNNQPDPEVGGLIFDPSTSQTTMCDAKGQMTWKYTLSPTLPHGNYDIVILADWEGVHWNWSWSAITV